MDFIYFLVFNIRGIGLRDLNTARQNITERYILQCDEIFVLSNIGRATTDAGVQAVFELAKEAQLANVGIICTKSDVSERRVTCRIPPPPGPRYLIYTRLTEFNNN